MLRRSRALLGVLVGAGCAVVLFPPSAFAGKPKPGSPFAGVQCGQSGTPSCQVSVGTKVVAVGRMGVRPRKGLGGTGPTVLPKGCIGGLRGGGGVCLMPNANGGGGGAGGRPAVAPVVLAQTARRRLVLPSPVIRSSPRPEDLLPVHLPIWLWVGGSVWRPRSATASVPGVTVTATATPSQATWSTGDGGSVVCHGPGTPYAGGDPSRPSPDCGHVYSRSSAGRPGEAFHVTVTVTWAITWAGAGENGTLAPLTTTAAAPFQVAQIPSLNTW